MGIAAGLGRRVRYAGWLVAWAVGAASAGGAIGFAVLGAVAHAYADGGWSFRAGYALLGLVAGGVVGLTLGIGRGLSRALADLSPALQAESARLAAERGDGARIATTELRRRWERVADEAVARSVGAVRLPGADLVARLVRARLRRGFVDDFLAACEREGVTSVGPAEIGRWIAAQGPAYLLAPAYAQLRVWRIVALAILVVAGLAPLVTALGGGS